MIAEITKTLSETGKAAGTAEKTNKPASLEHDIPRFSPESFKSSENNFTSAGRIEREESLTPLEHKVPNFDKETLPGKKDCSRESEEKLGNVGKTNKEVSENSYHEIDKDKPHNDSDGTVYEKEISEKTNTDTENLRSHDPQDANDAGARSGGTYGELKDAWRGKLEVEPQHEVHHMPANDINGLKENDGPAIVMEKADHRQTASCGNSLESREYRAKQKDLIDADKFDEAMQMDIEDIHDKFGSKYDEAIAEMKESAKEEGLI